MGQYKVKIWVFFQSVKATKRKVVTKNATRSNTVAFELLPASETSNGHFFVDEEGAFLFEKIRECISLSAPRQEQNLRPVRSEQSDDPAATLRKLFGLGKKNLFGNSSASKSFRIATGQEDKQLSPRPPQMHSEEVISNFSINIGGNIGEVDSEEEEEE